MNRFTIKEITADRIFNAIIRRGRDIFDSLSWMGLSRISKPNRNRLESFAGRHKAQRCFIMGNGPSLARMDLTPLKNEITFGLNRIYLLFDKISFTPTYFICVNELVLSQFSIEIRDLPIIKFLNWNRRSKFNFDDQSTNFVKLSLPLKDSFSKDITKPISGGGTVTFVAMQIAFFMGFNEVFLIGMDHNFIDQGVPNKSVLRVDDRDLNHFDPSYFPKGSKWQLPDLVRSELAYSIARDAFEAENRKIYDATINGKCMIFQKIDYSTLF